MITCEKFLNQSGEGYNLYTLKNSSGAYVQITNLGASVVSVCVPDKQGKLRDVVLSYSKEDGFKSGGEYFGATVGRCCGRIKDGKFSLGGKNYSLAVNNAPNHLHGGINGFSRRVWDCEIDGGELIASLFSPDGDEGYPANLKVTAAFSFSEDNALTIKYAASNDGLTICNLTNHAYFNLKGHGEGDVCDHLLLINADNFLPLDNNLIPTGEVKSVKNTPFDFTIKKTIGAHISRNERQLIIGNGYDHCYILNGKFAAFAYSPQSGITLTATTTQPAVQFYTANYVNVDSAMAKGGKTYKKFGGFCLETQGYPNAVNQPNFPAVTIDKEKNFFAETTYKFSVLI